MSGPKYSSWSLQRELQRSIRLARRASQQGEIRARLAECRRQAAAVSRELGPSADLAVARIGQWLAEAEGNLDGDLRIAWSGLNGVENYLRTGIPVLRAKRQRQEAAAAEGLRRREEQAEKRRQEELRREEEEARARALVAQMEEAAAKNPEVMNDGFRQRIALYSQALNANPANADTLKLAGDLLASVRQAADDLLQRLAEVAHLREALAGLVGAGPGGGGAPGGGPMSGSIGGMPVTVHVDGDKGELNFVLPEGGGCKAALEALQRGLAGKGVELGPVRIARTGEIWHGTSQGVSVPGRRLDA